MILKREYFEGLVSVKSGLMEFMVQIDAFRIGALTAKCVRQDYGTAQSEVSRNRSDLQYVRRKPAELEVFSCLFGTKSSKRRKGSTSE